MKCQYYNCLIFNFISQRDIFIRPSAIYGAKTTICRKSVEISLLFSTLKSEGGGDRVQMNKKVQKEGADR